MVHLPPHNVDPESLFNYLDENFPGVKIATHFDRIENENSKLLDRLSKAWFFDILPDGLKQSFFHFQNISTYVRKEFLNNKKSFLIPYIFNEVAKDSWFIPPTIMNITDGVVDVSSLDKDTIPLNEAPLSDYQSKYTNRMLHKGTAPKHLIDESILDELNSHAYLVDYLFSPNFTDRNDVEMNHYIKKYLGENIQFLDIL